MTESSPLIQVKEDPNFQERVSNTSPPTKISDHTGIRGKNSCRSWFSPPGTGDDDFERITKGRTIPKKNNDPFNKKELGPKDKRTLTTKKRRKKTQGFDLSEIITPTPWGT
jgi:hypothetical protein